MAKLKGKKVLAFPMDKKLAGDFQRAMSVARSIRSSQTLDEGDALALARDTGGQIALLPPETRLADRKTLLSLFDDMNTVVERLNTEKTHVQDTLTKRARHGTAGKAYRRSTAR